MIYTKLMDKKALIKEYSWILIYVFLVLGLSLVKGSLSLSNWQGIIGLVLGGLIGWTLGKIDKLVYVYGTHPEAQISVYVKHLLNKKNYQQVWTVLEQRKGELEKLTFKSALFQVTWVVLAVFALSSTAGWFGKMVVMGLGLKIFLNVWQDFKKDKEGLKKDLFWQVKREVTETELRGYVYLMLFIFWWLSWFLV